VDVGSHRLPSVGSFLKSRQARVQQSRDIEKARIAIVVAHLPLSVFRFFNRLQPKVDKRPDAALIPRCISRPDLGYPHDGEAVSPGISGSLSSPVFVQALCGEE
jgi:hypothetical protein